METANRQREVLLHKFPQQYKYTASNALDSLDREIVSWKLTLADSISNDSVKALATANIRDLMVAKLRHYPNFNSIEYTFYDLPDSASWQDVGRQIPERDSIKKVFAEPRDLLEHSAKLSEKQFGSLSPSSYGTSMGDGFNNFASARNPYKENSGGFNNPKGAIQAIQKGKLSKETVDSLIIRPEILEAATQKVSRLFSKYTSFSNSSDLTDAKKRSSLSGKTFFERIILGGTFNVVSTEPVSLDISPQVGYRFTSRFFVGIGMNYRVTFGDSISNQRGYVSANNTAVKVLLSYDIVDSWYLYSEGEFLGSKKPEASLSGNWKQNANYFVGVGRRFLIHPKVHMTLTALYNLNSDTQNQNYPQRFQLRLGFQSSDLAFRKKHINYDPNR